MGDMPLTMPKMSMTMEEGTMVLWLKNDGDQVTAGEPVCEVATDKVEMEVESPFDGTLTRIVAFPDDVVKVGEPIAFISTQSEDLFGDLLNAPFEPDARLDTEPAEELASSEAGRNETASSSGEEEAASLPVRGAAAETPLTMPKMSMTMEEGTMVLWLKNDGDQVTAGEPVCEVATDKVEMEVESPFDGTLTRIVAFPDDVVKVGEPIAFISTQSEDLFGDLLNAPFEPDARLDTEPAEELASSEAGGEDAHAGNVEQGIQREQRDLPSGRGRPAAVPLARRLAEKDRLDLTTVTGTGPWGAVRVQDVEQLLAPAPLGGPTPEAKPLPRPQDATPASQAVSLKAGQGRLRTRKQVAKVMTASAAIPQFTAYADIDLSTLAKVRKSLLRGVSWTTVLVKAQALSLRVHHHLNDYWEDADIVRNPHIGIGLAVDSERGLLAPVLHNPDLLPLLELDQLVRATAKAAREGKTDLASLSGGTAVFSNLGSLGVDSFNALLTPRQSTALSCGAVGPRVVALSEEAFGVRTGCTLGLTVDHRIADGADAARYLSTLREILSDPTRLGAVD